MTTSQSTFFACRTYEVRHHRPAQEERSGKSKPWAARTSPCDSQSYDAPKVRFSATVGEKPEVEVALV
jgi:hypothetical protein